MTEYRFYLRYVGNMGNCMLQVMIAHGLAAALGIPPRLATDDPRVLDRLEAWNLPIERVPAMPEARTLVRRQIRNLQTVARSVESAGHRDVEIATCNLAASQYPPLDAMRALFRSPSGLQLPEFGEDELVISVRAGEILKGIHRDYVIPPTSFYRTLVEETGLRPVLVGQVANDPYSDALRAALPGVRVIPSLSPIADFETLRRAPNLVLSVSTFALLAGWMSSANSIFTPLLGGMNPFQRSDGDNFPLHDPRYRFFLFPLFHMRHISDALPMLETHLVPWREVSGPMLRAMRDGFPRLRPTLAQCLEVFDAAFYLSRYPEVAAAIGAGKTTDPKAHFVAEGYAAQRAPCEVDEAHYLQRHPQVAWELGNGEFASVAEHYAAVGRVRGYRPVAG